jgi:hypothetical protein
MLPKNAERVKTILLHCHHYERYALRYVGKVKLKAAPCLIKHYAIKGMERGVQLH